MANAIQNALQLITHPHLAGEYVQYQYSKLRNRGKAKRTLCEGVEISDFSGFSEYHSCAEFVEADEYAFLTGHPFPPGPILDVGANLGVVSLVLAHRFPSRDIHAFEPNPSTARALRSNLTRNDALNVTPHSVAVGVNDTPIQFKADPRNRGTASQTTKGSEFATTVPCTSIDSFVEHERWDEIALLKVDVEGYETAVFEGAEALLLEQRVAVVYFEVCPQLARGAGFDPKAAASILERFGYSLHRLDFSGNLLPAQTTKITEVGLENWVALRS